MIRGLVIREAVRADEAGIADLLHEAFGGPAEARLVEELRRAGDRVLELVATHEGALYGEIFFSRLRVDAADGPKEAVALAPVAVLAGHRRTGIGGSLIDNAHNVLEQAGETLSVVLGEPAYYGRFGYAHARASAFECKWQGEYLQALAWGEAPTTGRLVYAPAFSAL